MRPGEERALLTSWRAEDAYTVAREYWFSWSFTEFNDIYAQEKAEKEEENRQKLIQVQNERNRNLVRRLLGKGG